MNKRADFDGPQDGEVGLDTWDQGPFLSRVMRVLPSIVYIFNQKTQSNEFANRSVAEAIGYSQKEIRAFGSDMMGLLCHPDDLPTVLQHFKQLSRLRDGEVISVEYRLRHKAGHWVWFLSRDTVFDRDEGGNIIRHLGVAADITQQKEAERQAITSSEDAAVANEDLRTLAYSISHDMKSPSNTLQLLLSELDKSHGHSMDEDALQLLDHARSTVDGMQRRIGRVLDYTRMIDRKADHLNVDLNEVIASVLSSLASDVQAAKAEIELSHLHDALGNSEELEVLFQNLILNALKYRVKGQTPKVRISSQSTSDEDLVRISVADNGIGISSSNHGQIFGMFKRLHSEKAYPGSGIGLAICRRIAISHGGDIWVRSKLGEGATFITTLRGIGKS